MGRSDLGELNDLLARIRAQGPFAFCDPESIKALQVAKAQFDSILAHGVLCFQNSGEWAPDGARNAAAWMSKECRLPTSEGKAQVRRGQMLESCPLVASAFGSGEIGVAQVDQLVRAHRSDPAIFVRDQELLVGLAQTLKFGQFIVALAHWKQLADPDGAEEAEFARTERRSAWLVPTPSGMYMGKLHLDPVSGAVVCNEHFRLESILFEADWAEAKERLGREPKVSELWRTPSQRSCDAFFEMARRSAAMPADAQAPDPLITILVDYQSLSEQVGRPGRLCRIEGGPTISPGLAAHLMDGAQFERIVFKAPNRIECSHKARFFTGGTRRAVEVRDQECGSPYCETPATRCQIDHIIPYAKGGLTTIDNARVLCGPCNRMRNVAEPPWAFPEVGMDQWPDPMVPPEWPTPGPEPPGG